MKPDVDPALQGPIPSLEKIATQITAPVPDSEPDLIPGLLPKAGQLVIAGETNVGKSLVALEICSSLTTGDRLWGERGPVPLEPVGRILYILGEHYNEVIQRLWQKTKLPMSSEVWLLGPSQLGADKWLVTGGRPNLVAVDKMSRWAESCGLVVFDPLAAFITGGDGIENDNNAMRTVLDQMSLVSQRTGAACLVLGHQGKPTQDPKTGAERSRSKYAIRGASSIEDAATNIFYMSKTAENKEFQSFDLTKRKYKGEAPDCYDLVRDPHTLVHTLLGNRPVVEVQKKWTQEAFGRLSAAFPDMKQTDKYLIMAKILNVHERTVQNHLQ